ncbi:MAG: hypothetical protein DWQ09_18205 [Proteobacteria bacterium]|nr:MAG: hypothetical protein DWQ09_18205 [Pseudomonadota bacterium]QKK11896.1 MAG: hypothetical protein HND59_10175 [Pseudomonadota bacterium]
MRTNPVKNLGPYKRWTQCPCGFAGIMEFHREADANYTSPADQLLVLHAECPSCGEWGQAGFSIEQLREMEQE